jgi:hypothetical protein
MHSRGRVLKFTAVTATVVLALTGFSSGHKSSGRHKSSHSDSDGGGGCSSSRQNHDSYTPRTTTTSTRHASTLQDGTAVLVSCATKTAPYATVEVTNPNSRQAVFEVAFSFTDASGRTLSRGDKQVTVSADGTSRIQVPASQAVLAKLDQCWVEPEADLVN